MSVCCEPLAQGIVPDVRWLWNRRGLEVVFLCAAHKKWLGGLDFEEISREEADVRTIMAL